MTWPHDIGIQVLCWLFNGKQAGHRFEMTLNMWVALLADDPADAHHGAPNLANQLNLCVIAKRNSEANQVEFYSPYTYLFVCLQQW